MADLFRSALNYIGGPQSSGNVQANEFVGQIIELGPLRLSIRRLLAEGGFAYIFLATDQKNVEYALKRLLASDKEANNSIVQEINFLKQLSGHPNITCCIQAASIGKDQYNMGRNEYLILMEYCRNGSLVDLMRNLSEPFNCEQVTKIFYHACRAVLHLHSQQPAVIHCDLKVENLLFDSNWTVKLCDFGSATTKTFSPDHSWTAQQRLTVEEELASRTTPMYRAPEMLDLYQNLPINEKLDIWALGCILYYLCYLQHPFEDSAKLRIINAKYSLPSNDSRYAVFHDLIFGMLQIDPQCRPGIQDVCERLEEIAAAINVNLNECLHLSQATLAKLNIGQSSQQQNYSPQHEPSKVTVKDSNSTISSSQNVPASAGLFGSIKGQAGSLFKNLKDTSAKVVQNVQTNKFGGIGTLFHQSGADQSSQFSQNRSENVNPASAMAPEQEKSNRHEKRPPLPPPVDYNRPKEGPAPPVLPPRPALARSPALQQPEKPITPPVQVEKEEPKVEALIEEADLLQLGISEPHNNIKPVETPAIFGNQLNDLLNSADRMEQQSTTPSPKNFQSASSDDDLLSFHGSKNHNSDANATSDLLQGWTYEQPKAYIGLVAPTIGGMLRNASAPMLANAVTHKASSSSINISNMAQKEADPFGDLSNIFSGVNSSIGNGQQMKPPPPPPPAFQQINHQTNSFAGFSNLGSAIGTATSGSNSTMFIPPPPKQVAPKTSPSSTPQFSRPNYGRNNFDNNVVWGQGAAATGSSKLDNTTFDDLLTSQNFPTGSFRTPQSMGAMKKVLENKELDPNSIKIRDWTEGKRRNIRALLCSMHTVIWDGNDKWDQCNMGQMVNPAQVKKFYRKACLAVHPDKLSGSEHLELARLIFTELNDAWNEFAKTEQIAP